MVDLGAVQQLLGRWWFCYDEGHFDVLTDLVTDDARVVVGSDSGEHPFEEFFRADITGRDAFLEWHLEHRRNSPYPLRHNATNVHLTGPAGAEAAFASYLFVTTVADGAVANAASGPCWGTIRDVDGHAKLAELRLILDMTDSVTFSDRFPTR